MIYDKVPVTDPIRQGDIFGPLPLPTLRLEKMFSLRPDNQIEELNWEQAKNAADLVITVPVKPIMGIVASQDCDAQRSPAISLFLIDEFGTVFGSTPKTPKGWIDTITKHSRMNASWFYLPEDNAIGLGKRMAVNFSTVFQIPREDLEKHRSLRVGRLNELATEHYREKAAHYFHRYAYDEWYPLNKEEFSQYTKDRGEVKPFSHQK